MRQNDKRVLVIEDRVSLHLPKHQRRLLDPADIYYLEATADDTWVRLASARRLREVRPLADLSQLLERHGFVRVHDRYLVNLRRVRLLRLRRAGVDWELKLEPPVNRVLPISRGRLRDVRAALGDS